MAPSRLRPLSGRYLSFEEREEISLLRAQGHGVRSIAFELGCAPSTISRELRRNAATRCGNVEYRATAAQWHADRRAKRAKVAKLAANDQLRLYVALTRCTSLDGLTLARPIRSADVITDLLVRRFLNRARGESQDRARCSTQ